MVKELGCADKGGQFSVSEVQRLKAKLQEIDDTMVNGKFVDAEGKELRGSDAVSDLLKRCLMWSDIVLERYVPQYPLPLSPHV